MLERIAARSRACGLRNCPSSESAAGFDSASSSKNSGNCLKRWAASSAGNSWSKLAASGNQRRLSGKGQSSHAGRTRIRLVGVLGELRQRPTRRLRPSRCPLRRRARYSVSQAAPPSPEQTARKRFAPGSRPLRSARGRDSRARSSPTREVSARAEGLRDVGTHAVLKHERLSFANGCVVEGFPVEINRWHQKIPLRASVGSSADK